MKPTPPTQCSNPEGPCDCELPDGPLPPAPLEPPGGWPTQAEVDNMDLQAGGPLPPATQKKVEVATLQDVWGKLVQGIGIVVTRVVIDETDHCDGCGITGRGRIAVAFGVGHVEGRRAPNPVAPGRCPVICWVCLKAARLVVDGPGVPP